MLYRVYNIIYSVPHIVYVIYTTLDILFIITYIYIYIYYAYHTTYGTSSNSNYKQPSLSGVHHNQTSIYIHIYIYIVFRHVTYIVRSFVLGYWICVKQHQHQYRVLFKTTITIPPPIYVWYSNASTILSHMSYSGEGTPKHNLLDLPTHPPESLVAVRGCWPQVPGKKPGRLKVVPGVQKCSPAGILSAFIFGQHVHEGRDSHHSRLLLSLG